MDKDAVAALLAELLDADLLAILTDVSYVYAGYGTPGQRPITAACAFSRATERPVAIGALEDLTDVVNGTSGTRIQPEAER